jgi:hypothetical protein
MRKIETVYIPVEKMCDVKYYIHCYPISDPHFTPDKDYILKRNGKILYFETKKEAKKEIEKHKGEWITMKICKKVTPIE